MAGEAVVGAGEYQLSVDNAKVKQGLNETEGAIRKSGTAAESAFGKQAAGGINKASTASTGLLGKMRAMQTSKGIPGAILGGLGIGAGLGVFSLVTTAIHAISSALTGAVRAAAEEEESINRLTTAIKANVEGWDGNIDAVERVIAQRVRLGFADDVQRDSLARLVSVTKDYEEALRIQGIAMDLARQRNMDLGAATDLLGKVYAGKLGALGRMGIVLDENATSTEALAEIQKRAAGQAIAWADATANKAVIAQLQLDDSMEQLGSTLTPVVADLARLASDVLPPVIEGLGNVVETMQPLLDALRLSSPAWGTLQREIHNAAFEAGLTADETLALTDSMQLLYDAAMKNTEGMDQNSREMVANKIVQDALAAALEAHANAADDATDADAELAAAQAAAARQAKILNDALETVASTGFSDVKDAAKAAQEAIREAAKSETWAALARERDKLRQQERRLAAEGEFDAAAIARNRRREVQEQIDAFRKNSLGYRAQLRERQRADREAAAEFAANRREEAKATRILEGDLGLTTKAAEKLWEQTKKKYDIKAETDWAEITKALIAAEALYLQTQKDYTINVHTNRYGLSVPAVPPPPRRAFGGPTQGNLAYLVGENGPEIWMERRAGRILDTATSAATLARSRGGDNHYHLNPTFVGQPLYAETPAEAVSDMRRAARLGFMTPRTGGAWR